MGKVNFDEAAVWALSREGDAASFGLMFDAHRDRVFGQALRQMRSSHDAEDVAALVFLEAWRRRDSVRVVDGSIIGWLLVTTNNVARNVARSRRRFETAMRSIPPLENELDHSDAVNDRLDRLGQDARVNDAFSQLSKRDQDVITLCVLEEFSMPEAAQALDVPLGTVKSRLSRAKQRLAVLTTQIVTPHPSASGGAQ
ncbi:MAG: hypothetical protein JWQ64_2549 [Subtercola sp.]|jgi:RNA polymerase sigma factor (sigma-70 family)|nr:hypothetical protein [Subtercola sp.]